MTSLGSALPPAERTAAAEQILSRLESLPTLAPIAVKLLALTSSSGTAAADVVALLARDQSLTARILSVANNCARTAPGGVKTLDRAVVLLGFATVRSIVLAVKFFEYFGGSQPAQDDASTFSPSEFWRHSLAVACAARGLASACPGLGVRPDEAWIAGLIHDLGKVALHALFPKAYQRAVATAYEGRGDIVDCEREVLGVDHTVTGHRVARLWKLPRSYQEAIWLHHLSLDQVSGSAQSRELVALIQLADTLAREQHIGRSGNHQIYESSADIARRLGAPADALERVTSQLVGEVAEQAALLGLDGTTTEALYLRAVTDANAQLSRLHNELLTTNQRLAAGARFFRATALVASRLDGQSDVADVVAAIAAAGPAALQRPTAAAFGVRSAASMVDVAWMDGTGASAATVTPDAALRDWLNARQKGEALIRRAPAELRQVLACIPAAVACGEPWLAPVARGGELLGGIILFSDEDAAERIAAEQAELNAFVASLGLTLETARAQAAARQLSEDLAETNRRLQQAQARLLRQRTLSMIAEMASGAAHELNSPLAVISGRAQMLRDRSPDPETRRALEIIHARAHECSRIVSELLEFAQPRPPDRAAVDLPALLTELRESLLSERSMPASSFRVDVSGVIPSIHADAAQLQTVFRELLANAFDALFESGGFIAVNCVARPADDVVEVTVRDNGIGMPPAVLERAFDPFFSHRRAGRGRGFGLARAYRIVEQHGGRLWLQSCAGEGTTAHVVLPIESVREPPAREPRG
ncbi:MAG: Adaptive-response sensory-kinase SasA [Phycisphaerae bacterium]|nr:Adaptive-response sensory-kinase SasA [Phycisphaerae bacterium]